MNLSSDNDKYKQYFTGGELVEVGGNGSTDYEVTYSPMTMTSEGRPH